MLVRKRASLLNCRAVYSDLNCKLLVWRWTRAGSASWYVHAACYETFATLYCWELTFIISMQIILIMKLDYFLLFLCIGSIVILCTIANNKVIDLLLSIIMLNHFCPLLFFIMWTKPLEDGREWVPLLWMTIEFSCSWNILQHSSILKEMSDMYATSPYASLMF